MCGIYFEALKKSIENEFWLNKDEKLLKYLCSRGPDYQGTCGYENSDYSILFFCSVLWMQGDELIKQPLENKNGILAYNGDNFGTLLLNNISDTLDLFLQLSNTGDSNLIIKTVRSFIGPFSFIYLNKKDNKLFFSRDRLGRNSLLCHVTKNGFILSSVLSRCYEDTIEIPTTHIHMIDLNSDTITLYSWCEDVDASSHPINDWLLNILQEQMQPDNNAKYLSSSTLLPDEKAKELIDFIETTCKNNSLIQNTFSELLQNNHIYHIVEKLIHLLRTSVEIRVKRQPQKCQECIKLPEKCSNHCTVSVLFSGGLDCTILALIADEYVCETDTIDLLNVAFNLNGTSSFDVPDRLTGKLAYEELKKLRPQRRWCFKEINVNSEQLHDAQIEVIADLVFPRRTILDESLGSALWFASRGLTNNTNKSTSRVVLVGSGADELFGGYTRHRNALKRRSWTGLHEELLLDWMRLPHRNLARDNRVISHHSRQPRMPYLDEDFADYVNSLKPWERCVPSESCGPGIGDKLYLRLVAFELGLREHVSFFPKRAIQFGSRIANKKENGADISLRFLNKCDINN